MGYALPSAGRLRCAGIRSAAWGPVRPNAGQDRRGRLVCHADCRYILSQEVEYVMHIETFAEGGLFTPARIAEPLRTTKEEVARTVGLGRDALMRPDRCKAPRPRNAYAK